MLDLYVTHGRHSEEELHGLREDLVALGDRVLKEPERGAAWWDQTLALIRSCDAFVFALTPRTLESEACWRQMRYAHALGKPLLAVALHGWTDFNAVPAPLTTSPFVDYRERDRDGALRLCKALRRLGKARALPRNLPLSPAPPPPDLTGLRSRINSASKLDADRQMRLIAELARELNDPRTSIDARELLLSLQGRRDLTSAAANEIDALLRRTAATRMNLRPLLGQLLASAEAGRPAPLWPLKPSRAGAPRHSVPPRPQVARRVSVTPVIIALASLVLGAASWLIASGALRSNELDGSDVRARARLPASAAPPSVAPQAPSGL
jgi:hypothetical protein